LAESQTVVRFEHVCKSFALHKERPRSLQELALALVRGGHTGRRERHSVLDDVCFEIERGETVGLVGPNGAGKSTVLKLMSRILQPTSGTIGVDGRVGALLELGAGFHPDLTGRDNIFLNGSLLGLHRAEINGKLDQIIEFAELERFIDVPVKYYSSGMYVRLGFAVAVHTEPEILLVDEVLAVGDAAFQRKCLDRIQVLRRNGVTILFVSHSAEIVRRVCSRVLWLEEGRLVADGPTEAVTSRYLARSWRQRGVGNNTQMDEESRWGSGEVRIEEVCLLNGRTEVTQEFETSEPLVVQMRYAAGRRIDHPVFGLAIHRSDGTHITGPNTRFADVDLPFIDGTGVVTYTVPRLPLLEGTYSLSVSVHDREDTKGFDYHDRAYPFRVLPSRGERYGLVTLGGTWKHSGDG
jgi:lipopolysaccharide transport system ATP-binding protein